MQCACTVLYCRRSPAGLYSIFPHYFINCTIFERQVIEHKMCVLIFSETSVWNISHSKKNWSRSNMYIGLHVKYPLFLSGFNETWICRTDFREMLKYKISWNSAHWKSSFSMRTDGWMDGETDRHDEINSRFSQFCERACKDWNKCK